MAQTLPYDSRPLAELKPFEGNPRIHSPGQIRRLVRSLKAYGPVAPIIVDDHDVIIVGHGRYMAAKQLGLSEFPVLTASHLTPAQVRAYRLIDNRLAEDADWELDLLRIELQSLIEIDYDVDLTGFSAPEIDLLLVEPVGDDTPEEPPPPLPAENRVVTRAGDLWQLGRHRLICGDCRDPAVIDRLMAGAVAALAVTDPPYNVPIPGHVCGNGRAQHENFLMASGEMSAAAFESFLRASLGELSRVSKNGAVHFVFMDWRHLPELLGAGRAVYEELLNLCVWAKSNGGMGSLYRSQHELVLVFKKGTAPHRNNVELGRHGRNRTNVWRYPGVNSFGADRDEALEAHPTVKPVRLVADAILDVSRRGDIVLDGFLGSGTTLLAAEQTGRVCYGIELDPRYMDVALRRWQAATGEVPVLAEGGQAFEAIETARADERSSEA